MNTKQVGQELIALCTSGHFFEAIDTLYSPDIVSIEAVDSPAFAREVRGIEAVRDKNKRWSAANDVHSIDADGPWQHQDRFAVRWSFDISPSSGPTQGERSTFDEIAIYTVADGKIVKEEFFYDV